MTKQASAEDAGERTAERRCAWCRRALPERSGPGRPRRFCSQACRQWDWVARQRARELELADGELVVARTMLDELGDDLYALSCAIDDVDSDLADLDESKPRPSTEAAELRRILSWLLDTARPLATRSPPAITS